MEPLPITRRDARVSALTGIIDYAGLFPPTSLDMATAVAEYRDARAAEHAWLVHRFICPVARLEELAGLLVPTLDSGDEPWQVVAIGSSTSAHWRDDVDADVLAIAAFDEEMHGGAGVDVVERPVVTGPDLADDLAWAATRHGRMVFFEIPWADPGLEAAIGAVAQARVRSGRAMGAKIRCGGVAADAFPPPQAVAAFLISCRDHALPVKATAGLHHPFRHLDADTGFTHHGFVNVLVAAALAADGEGPAILTDVLADEDPASFRLDRAGLGWRDHIVSAAALDATRSGLFVGYGSCSIDEPVDDLTDLGVLPVAQ
jgi:hypothetical protein